MGVPTDAGRVLAGRYRLVSTLGSGGMGTVWLALDDLLGRQVAVKEFSPPSEVSEAERDMLRERTMREARTAARLSHPNVVTIYDVIDDDSRPWIVMELIPARSLRDVVQEDGPLTPQQAAKVGLQVLAALRAAHDLGILHRDVKPGNVLIDGDGRAVLADFGIAHAQDSPTLTVSGMLVGSPSYIAPERARGERGGPASDLWSLGAMLYAIVEGRPPYDRGGALATLMAVVNDDPEPPRRAGVLWPVISGLLTREPARRLRPATAERMLQRIAQADPAPRTTAFRRFIDAVGGGDGGSGGRTDTQGLKKAERTRAFYPGDAEPPVLAGEAEAPAPAVGDAEASAPAVGDAEASAPAGQGDAPAPVDEVRVPPPVDEVRVPPPAAPADDAGLPTAPAEEEASSPAPADEAGWLTDPGEAEPLVPADEAELAPPADPTSAPPDEASAPPDDAEPATPADSAELTEEPDDIRPVQPTAGEESAAPSDAAELAALAEAPELAALAEVPEPAALAEAPEPAGLAEVPEPAGPAPIAEAETPEPPPPADSLQQPDQGPAVTEPVAAMGAGPVPGIPYRPATAPGEKHPARRRQQLTWLIAGAAAMVAVVVGTLLALNSPGHPSSVARGHHSGSTPSVASSATSGPQPSSSSGAATTPNPAPSQSSGLGAATIPAGYHNFVNSTGFSIAVPNGWTVSHQGNYVYLSPPSGGMFLLIDQSDQPKPNPLADWQQQEANRIGTYPNYHRIRLEAVNYPQAQKAADWEFTYDHNGTPTHVLNRNILANAHHAYALYWSTPESEWTQDFHIFQVLAQSFRPASP